MTAINEQQILTLRAIDRVVKEALEHYVFEPTPLNEEVEAAVIRTLSELPSVVPHLLKVEHTADQHMHVVPDNLYTAIAMVFPQLLSECKDITGDLTGTSLSIGQTMQRNHDGTITINVTNETLPQSTPFTIHRVPAIPTPHAVE